MLSGSRLDSNEKDEHPDTIKKGIRNKLFLNMDLLLNNSENFGKSKRLGGATRDRTADLLHAMQALSQLSYNPKERVLFYRWTCTLSNIFFKNSLFCIFYNQQIIQNRSDTAAAMFSAYNLAK